MLHLTQTSNVVAAAVTARKALTQFRYFLGRTLRSYENPCHTVISLGHFDREHPTQGVPISHDNGIDFIKYLKAKSRYTDCSNASLNIRTAHSWFGPQRRSFSDPQPSLRTAGRLLLPPPFPPANRPVALMNTLSFLHRKACIRLDIT